MYEEGKLLRAAECDITLDDNEFVVSKSLVNSIFYVYGEEDKLIRKRVVDANGAEQIIYYENTEDESTVVKFTAGGKTVTSHSKTDSFGRKVFDELQLGTGFVSRQFSYHAGEVTEEHKDNAKLKSSATTQLVSQIVLSGGRTISYEYDAEERITKVIDSVDGTTEYTYDALGQLLTETKDDAVINTMTYDNYGNIKTKNGIEYTYGDENWKDLLTGFGDKTISYDAQGNPTNYLGHTLTWEKGRQLKSFDDIVYTYNANGIRTSKTLGGIKHTYTLDGTKILRETWNGNTLIPMYDNEESVCGIIYNSEPYYFQKNLQGDVIALVDKEARVVARYTYDAWGVPAIAEDTTDIGIATINPFRYRGYYYDAEIGLYYVSSRYYDPEIGRWVSSDSAEILLLVEGVISNNLFAYCNNNSVNTEDENGYISARLISAIVCGIVNAIFDILIQLFVTFITYYRNSKKRKGNPKYKIKWWSVTMSAITGALGGLLMASRAKRIIQCVGGGVINALSGLIVNIRKKNFKSALCNFIIDFSIGALWGALSGNGLANKYYVKGLFGKGYYAYNGLRYTTSSFQMNKIVFKDFAKAMWYFFATCFSNLIKNVVGAVT